MDNGHNHSQDSKAFRARLDERTGQEFWRGLEELADTDEFRDFLEDEFPQQSRPLQMPVDRRQFLTLMGASLALAGLSGCRFLPQDKIVPYVNQPEDLVLGIPLFYTTAMTFGGYATGLLAESHEGRPTKLEGNPTHPASLGSSSALMQAAILNLYDPDRSQNVLNHGEISTWDGPESFEAAMQTALAQQAAKQGAGIRILTETVSSPTLVHQMGALLKRYPSAKWIQYEPVNRESAHEGARLAFGKVVNSVYKLDKADVIVSLDADFLLNMPGSVRYARDFADRRRVRGLASTMNRLYVIESAPTITGATSDNLLRIRASEIEGYARALAAELGVAGVDAGKTVAPEAWVKEVAADLKSADGKAVVIVGDQQPPAVHALAHAINGVLNAQGSTVVYTDPIESDTANQTLALKGLADEMAAGAVDMLFILGGNPVYTAPADIDFAGPLRSHKVGFSMHLGTHDDETGALCDWHVPEAHFLESWSDGLAYDGTASIVQPLIAPLFTGRSPHEIVGSIMGSVGGPYDWLRAYWKSQYGKADFEAFWQQSLIDGVIANTARPAVTVTVSPGLGSSLGAAPVVKDDMEVIFRPDPTIWDGRYSNNGWLQELPKPLLKVSWDNAVIMSPNTAVKLGLGARENPYDDVSATEGNEKVVEVTLNGRKVKGSVWVIPGHPDNSVTVYLGYGRTHTGKVGSDLGFNAGLLRTSNAPWFAVGATVTYTGDKKWLATTQYHHSMANRDIIRTASIKEYHARPMVAEKRTTDGASSDPALMAGYGKDRQWGSGGAFGSAESLSIYDGNEHKYDGYAWGMSVDLTTCIGCQACVQACQAENNIPVVGKDQVARGRDMHWIRIDTYYRGQNTNAPEGGTYFQPVMCQHCELAPCEPVCPVAATVHSHEGLNQMVYNRCVGTKYCSNNCPYKVRRFNFYKYIAGQPDNAPGNYDNPTMKLSANPNVTLRGRGVMEKCSFCVQRINAARINAKKEDRLIRDGEIQTACQQACPTKTIVFGNIADPNSEVTRLKHLTHDYALLGDLNTRPRLTYLAKIKNPNPALEAQG
jgi:molybdopterin-containing oxidoreductase family iron-sulfur binding subunit